MNIQKKTIKSIVDKAHELLIKKGICSRDGSGDPIIEGAISYLLLFANGQLVVDDPTSKKPRGDREHTIQERQFIVIDKGTPPKAGEDDHLYSTYHGAPYQEDSLRQWAHETFGTPLTATLNVVARDIHKGGWLLYEGIWQADPDPD